MENTKLVQLKAEIQREENLYLAELNSMQRYDVLRASLLKINVLKQQVSQHELGEPPAGLSLM